MAINTSSITQLITDLRALTVKDSIKPETIGYILQRIADLLATASTDQDLAPIQSLVGKYKTLGKPITSLVQGKADRNNVMADVTQVSLADGTTTTATRTMMLQATTERAGAMRAQQVIDLNAAKTNVSVLQKQLQQTNADLETTNAKLAAVEQKNTFREAQISCEVRDGKLFVIGATQLITDGYVPYIFRSIRKRNKFNDKKRDKDKEYCTPTKGWALFGSMYSVKVYQNQVFFTTDDHHKLSNQSESFSPLPVFYVSRHKNQQGDTTIGWGRTSIHLRDNKRKTNAERMIRLRYGIGFAKPIKPGRAKVTPANLVSSLAEFCIVYDTGSKQWSFTRP